MSYFGYDKLHGTLQKVFPDHDRLDKTDDLVGDGMRHFERRVDSVCMYCGPKCLHIPYHINMATTSWNTSKFWCCMGRLILLKLDQNEDNRSWR